MGIIRTHNKCLKKLMYRERRQIVDDCTAFQKVVAVPIYNSKLEESFEKSQNALRDPSWYMTAYNSSSRYVQSYMNNDSPLSTTAFVIYVIFIALLSMLTFFLLKYTFSKMINKAMVKKTPMVYPQMPQRS